MKLNYSAGNRDFRVVIPFSKTEKMPDGRLMVEGIATSEALDGDQEIIDYASAKAAFEAWPGNIREQHDPKKAVGRALNANFDDATKQITVRSFISSGAPDTQAKIQDGTLTCYSIGGSVDKRVPEKATKADGVEVDAKRVFIQRLLEISVVDQGCNPETSIALVKTVGDHLENVALADVEKVEELQLEVTGTDAEVADFAKALNESGMSMADAIKAVRDAAALKANPPAAEHEAIVAMRAAFARSDDLAKQLADPGLTVAAAALLAKEYEEPLGDDFAARILAKASSRHSKEDAAHLQTAHDALCKVGAACKTVEGDVTKAAPEFTKLQSELAEAQEAIKKLQAQPLPLRTVALLKTVSKTEDNAPDLNDEAAMKKFHVYNTDGSLNEAATTIKFTQSLGGKRINAQTIGS